MLSHDNHVFQQQLKSHCMAAKIMTLEIGASTLPFARVVTNGVVVVLSFKRGFKLIEANSLGFLGITLGFVYLADHSTVHHIGELHFSRYGY